VPKQAGFEVLASHHSFPWFHKMSKRSAVVYVNKLAAARRQLDAAIRMKFLGEDELAIHTVAAAAYRILCEPKAKRGRDELEDLHLRGVFAVAEAYAKGSINLPPELASDKTMMDLIEWIAGIIRTRDNVTEDEFKVELSHWHKKSYWSTVNKPTNFLKHADRDSNKALALKDLNTDYLIGMASAAYADLTGETSAECLVFYMATLLQPDTPFRDHHLSTTPFKKEIAELQRLAPRGRAKACLHLIAKLKSHRSFIPPGD